MVDITYVDVLTSISLGCALCVLILRYKARRLPLPPGPRTSWFGSVDLPKKYPWKTYAEWRKIYGDVIYIHVFGNPIIVLNSVKAANDLLDKRSNIYSSKVDRTMTRHLMGWDWLFSLMPYGSWWKRHTALFHQYFGAKSISSYYPVIAKEVHVMLQTLVETPDDFSQHIRRTTAAIIMNIVYGHQMAPEGDRYVTLADEAMSSGSNAGIFGTYMVDYIPFLRYIPTWMPGADFKRKALGWRKLSRAMRDEPFEDVKRRMASGTATSCIVVSELEQWLQSANDPSQEEVIRNVAATVYAGNSDTTASALLSFFLAVTIYPEVLKRAQNEIDRVVGKDRLPSFADRDSLPYIMWIVWECLRWNPAIPLGLAHTLTEDDVYEGYFIPKGTTIETNTWLMLHDEKTYPAPLQFQPERYADVERNAQLGINQIPLAAFGFGRRMCPGRWFAIDTIWFTVAAVAAVFDISKPLDENGIPIEANPQYTSALLSRPEPYKCNIVPRSDASAALIRQTSEVA
ncbi:hypothetical protein AcV5_010217 [Taiwanofungus camphoratus]|nr:hypothetical protein AcV5_010217 [Antrodia cinnamomea]